MKHAHADYGPLGPLFERIVLKTTGQELRDEGIKKVSEHNENWMEKAIMAASLYAKYHPGCFTGEDIRIHAVERVCGPPRHPNAFGALINTLVKRKIIVPTGEYRQPKDKSSHARAIQVYKALWHPKPNE